MGAADPSGLKQVRPLPGSSWRLNSTTFPSPLATYSVIKSSVSAETTDVRETTATPGEAPPTKHSESSVGATRKDTGLEGRLWLAGAGVIGQIQTSVHLSTHVEPKHTPSYIWEG